MAKKKIELTQTQIAHLVNSTIKNLIEFHVIIDERDDLHFLLILDCMFPDECIGIDVEPENETEIFDIMCAHSISELAPFLGRCMRVRGSDGVAHRAFDTVPINIGNVSGFVSALSEVDSFWSEIDGQIQEEDDIKKKTKGKNVVEGNGTVN